MYEVEFKVELTKEEKNNLEKVFQERNFAKKGVNTQHDYYIEAKKSPIGGYDLKRYRDEGGKFIYTEKIWEDVSGEKARRENEHEVSEEEFKSVLLKFPDALKIRKQREWFLGNFKNQEISLTIDSVKFDHSPDVRYFMEAEIDTNDQSKVKETKNLIQDFLKNLLGKSEITESPGMFKMAFEKL